MRVFQSSELFVWSMAEMWNFTFVRVALIVTADCSIAYHQIYVTQQNSGVLLWQTNVFMPDLCWIFPAIGACHMACVGEF